MSCSPSVTIRPLSGALGAEGYGMDISHPLQSTEFAILRQTFFDYGVIFVRGQNLSSQQLIQFAKLWGSINVNRFFPHVGDYPQIAQVKKTPQQENNIGGIWHTDHSYDVIPALGSVLYARTVPKWGGDTLFANPAKAFDGLSSGMQGFLEGMFAVHSSRHVFGVQDSDQRFGNQSAATQDAKHPVVIRHPDTNRKTLYVNPQFTLRFDGWTQQESQPILNYLYQHIVKPEFTCRFRWREGSVAVWDNRATWHCALNDYPGEMRCMHRITIDGVSLH